MPSVPFPSTPPASHSAKPMPTSHSTPHLSSPAAAPSSPTPASPSPSPYPRPHTKNYHPYLIQTTSSSLLTRSNSSPAQPVHSFSGHRPSKSMSSLHYAGLPAGTVSEGEEVGLSPGPGANGSASASARDDVRRRSMDSPRTGGEKPVMRRSGTLPSFPTVTVEKSKMGTQDINLPIDPKDWTTTELAKYLVHTLRTGGPDGQGDILPAPLVKDIETWVFRQSVTGRTFLRMNATQSDSSRPPPFLVLLQSISRRLRRTSLQGRLSGADHEARLDLDSEGQRQGAGSILLEEDESPSPKEKISRVKRMAHAWESGSASESEDVHSATPLKPQWTGESDRSAIWRRWEGSTGTSAGAGAIGIGRTRRQSANSVGSVGGMADTETSPRLSARNLSGGSGSSMEDSIETPLESTLDSGLNTSLNTSLDTSLETVLDSTLLNDSESEQEGQGGTVKGLPKHMAPVHNAKSPPPPYTSPDPADGSPAKFADLLGAPKTPDAPSERSRSSVTPTPERPASVTDSTGAETRNPTQGATERSGFPQTHNTLSRATGSNPYRTLRRSSNSHSAPSTTRKLTLTSLRQAQVGGVGTSESEASDDEANDSPRVKIPGSTRWSTARRVTLRPTHVNTVFASAAASGSPGPPGPPGPPAEPQPQPPQPSAKEKEMAEQMTTLIARIKELENRLASVEDSHPTRPLTPKLPATPTPTPTPTVRRPTSPVLAMLPDSVLESLGLIPPEDGLPTSVRQLPAYLFLVGVGVGAVMVRVLLGRSR